MFLPKIVTGFLIFLSVVLYLNYFEWGKFTEAMGRRLVSGTITASEPVARVIVPGISLNGTVRNLLRSLGAEKLSRTKLEIPGVSAGSPRPIFVPCLRRIRINSSIRPRISYWKSSKNSLWISIPFRERPISLMISLRNILILSTVHLGFYRWPFRLFSSSR